MSDLQKQIQAFALLGKVIREYVRIHFSGTKNAVFNDFSQLLHDAVQKTLINNPWYISDHLIQALHSIENMLVVNDLNAWLRNYSFHLLTEKSDSSIGVIMAGNIPAVGFHDFLSVLVTGYHFSGKLSSEDPFLLPCFAKILIYFEKGLENKISFHAEIPKNVDAVIATGSNNTARYFEYHYGTMPHIFRQNRNGIAVLTGKETAWQLRGLTKDVFMHFGLGCRNVSKLYLPTGYSFKKLLKAFESAVYVTSHKPFMNNYQHQKAIATMQGKNIIDNGFILLLNSVGISSQPATLHYEFYESPDDLGLKIKRQMDQVQCIVSLPGIPFPTIGFGKTQQPGLGDNADGIDTIKFLIDLKIKP